MPFALIDSRGAILGVGLTEKAAREDASAYTDAHGDGDALVVPCTQEALEFLYDHGDSPSPGLMVCRQRGVYLR